MSTTDQEELSETREFKVTTDDKVEGHELLNEQMVKAGYTRISGDNYDEEGVVAAWGWNDLDQDGEVG